MQLSYNFFLTHRPDNFDTKFLRTYIFIGQFKIFIYQISWVWLWCTLYLTFWHRGFTFKF